MVRIAFKAFLPPLAQPFETFRGLATLLHVAGHDPGDQGPLVRVELVQSVEYAVRHRIARNTVSLTQR